LGDYALVDRALRVVTPSRQATRKGTFGLKAAAFVIWPLFAASDTGSLSSAD